MPTLLISLVLLLQLAAPRVGVAAPACDRLEAAHEAMLEGPLVLTRTLEMSVNGDLKKREVARMTLSAGELDTEVLEEESRSKVFVFEGDGTDPALSIGFDCARLEELAGGRYRLTSEDGLETALFELTAGAGRSMPVEWRFATDERFLFKKFAIRGRARYRVESR